MLSAAISQLPFHKSNLPDLPLEYFEHPVTLTQRRFLDRTMLIPDLNLKDYRFHAVFDWIEVRLCFDRTTQFQHIRKHINELFGCDPYVKTINPGVGIVGNVFDVKFQEPKSLAWTHEVCQSLNSKFSGAAPAKLNRIEISVDATPLQPDDKARRLLLGAMQRSIFPSLDVWSERDSRPRSAYGSNAVGAAKSKEKIFHKLLPEVEGKLAYILPEGHRSPAIDGTMYLGAKNDDAMIRLMDKVVDRQDVSKGTCVALTEDKKRVRIEVTLQAPELERLKINTLVDLKEFSMKKFQGEYFKFMLPTFWNAKPKFPCEAAVRRYIDNMRREVFLLSGVVGTKAIDRQSAEVREREKHNLLWLAKQNGRGHLARIGEGSTGSHVSYNEMNAAVANALSLLARRERRAWSKPKKGQ